jgi:hypothetical protein
MDAKRAFYKAIETSLSATGVPAGEIKIILIEVPAEN